MPITQSESRLDESRQRTGAGIAFSREFQKLNERVGCQRPISPMKIRAEEPGTFAWVPDELQCDASGERAELVLALQGYDPTLQALVLTSKLAWYALWHEYDRTPKHLALCLTQKGMLVLLPDTTRCYLHETILAAHACYVRGSEIFNVPRFTSRTLRLEHILSSIA